MLFSFVHDLSWIEEQLACNVQNFSMYNKPLFQSLASYFLCWSKWVCLLVKENICLWHASTSPPKHPWLITEETSRGKRGQHHPPEVFLAWIFLHEYSGNATLPDQKHVSMQSFLLSFECSISRDCCELIFMPNRFLACPLVRGTSQLLAYNVENIAL